MYEYLLDAETKLVTDGVKKNATSHPEVSGNTVPVAAGAGDTNICGGIVQLYWNSILERCLDDNEQIRQTSLKVRSLFLFLRSMLIAKLLPQRHYHLLFFLLIYIFIITS